MLDHARPKIPAICLYTPMGDIRLTISGPTSRYPGIVNVTTVDFSLQTSGEERREYLGWID